MNEHARKALETHKAELLRYYNDQRVQEENANELARHHKATADELFLVITGINAELDRDCADQPAMGHPAGQA